MADTKISALTTKATPIAADITNILDSAASNADKKATLGSLPFTPTTGSLVSTSTPVTVTVANNGRIYIQTTTSIEYDLPTGDLSSYVAAGVVPVKFTFVKTTADTLTVDPGTGNFIAGGSAGKKISDSTAGETWATLVLLLFYSTASVNKWAIIGAHGTWDMET